MFNTPNVFHQITIYFIIFHNGTLYGYFQTVRHFSLCTPAFRMNAGNPGSLLKVSF